MLELPESVTIAKQMEESIKGKIVSYVEVLHTPHRFAFFKGDPARYGDWLEGQRIENASSHGGMVELDTENFMIVFNDGAYPRFYEDQDKFPKNRQFAIYFDDGTAIFVSVQMYGGITVCPAGQCEDAYYLSASRKPSPLSDQFTYEYFRKLFPQGGRKLSLKGFLATKQRIPGLGNGVLQDILWDAGLDPRMDGNSMTEQEFWTLYCSVKKVLKEMCDGGGRDTEKDLYGNKGGYVTQLCKNSLYEPCMKCGHEIQKANYMGGTVYFCERCQKRKGSS